MSIRVRCIQMKVRGPLRLSIILGWLSLFACGPAFSAGNPSDKSAALATATFAGGCFWCMEAPFDALDGVVETISGYTGGGLKNPSYEAVSAGGTGHAEAVQVIYDPARIDYSTLLKAFWRNIDPTVSDRQFCDAGNQYRSAIFYHDQTQQRLAEESKAQLEKSKPFEGPILTEITAFTEFYPAEDYHQNYYQRNPLRYRYYRFACGRDQRLEQLWGKTAKRKG